MKGFILGLLAGLALFSAIDSTRWREPKSAAPALEPDDPQWSESAERWLWRFLATREPGSEITKLDCRTTYCELQALLPTPEAARRFEGLVTRAIDPLQTPEGPLRGFNSTTLRYRKSLVQTYRIQRYDSEPKDVHWAHAMERWLREYFASRAEASHYEITNIDCRTSYCRINALGHTAEAARAFDLVMCQLVKQLGPETFMDSSRTRGSKLDYRLITQETVERRTAQVKG